MSRLRLAPSGPALRLAESDLRLLPWVDSWDPAGAVNDDPAEWQAGGRLGGMDLGWGTWPATRLRITARLSQSSAAGAFAVEFGREDTVDDGAGNPSIAWEVLDASAFHVSAPYLLSMAGAPLGPVAVGAPVDTYGRYWSATMPARTSVGLSVGAPAVMQLRVLAQLRAEAAQAAYWTQNIPADTPEPAGHTFGELRAAWQVRYAAELAWNAAAQPFNRLFLVSAPSA